MENEDRFLFHILSEKSMPNISKYIVYELNLLNCKRKIFQDMSTCKDVPKQIHIAQELISRTEKKTGIA